MTYSETDEPDATHQPSWWHSGSRSIASRRRARRRKFSPRLSDGQTAAEAQYWGHGRRNNSARDQAKSGGVIDPDRYGLAPEGEAIEAEAEAAPVFGTQAPVASSHCWPSGAAPRGRRCLPAAASVSRCCSRRRRFSSALSGAEPQRTQDTAAEVQNWTATP